MECPSCSNDVEVEDWITTEFVECPYCHVILKVSITEESNNDNVDKYLEIAEDY